jgi:hypothetical protein
VAQPRKPRPVVPPADSRRDAVAQSFRDAFAHSFEQPGGFDAAPLLIALRLGVLDEHLGEIGALINDRIATLNAVAELVAASKLHVGDRVRLGHNLKPLYLHGRAATIVAKDGDKWTVRLDEPVGRFTNADIRLQAIQLERA